MTPKQIEDYLKEGIYGAKEINPEERKVFLGTFRERVELALTTGQVMTAQPYPQVEAILKNTLKIHMLLNGDITYSYLSKYIKLANQYSKSFTIVQNESKATPIGLILTHETSVDKANIFVEDSIFQQTMPL